jgi:hypothetical protein
VKTTHVLKILNGVGGDRPDTDFDPKWLDIGTQIEMEHTSRWDVARIICKQHLTQDRKNYYKYLIEMEERLKQEREWEQYIGS